MATAHVGQKTPTFTRKQWLALISISLSVALIIVDSTIVNVAIPSIVGDLGITSTQVQWVQESYTLVFAALLLMFGALADRYGQKRLLVLGVVIFAGSSVFAALAPTGDLLIASRVLQGVGGAMVLPTTLSLINTGFTGRARGLAFAVWGSTIGGMVAVGPLLGGWLTTAFSWRWAFGINIPLGILIVIGIVLTVVDAPRAAISQRIDIGGAVLSVVASASLVFGLIEGRTLGWWLSDATDPFTLGNWTWNLQLSPVPISLALFVVATTVFILRARHREALGKPTLLSLQLFSIRSFRNGNVAALIVSLGEFGIILALPLWLQNVVGYDALQTGFVLLALALGSFVASGMSVGISKKATPITMVRIGLGAEVIGVLGLAWAMSPDASWLAVTPFLFIYGIGVGFATAQLTGVILQDVPVDRSGQGSGTQSTARQVGSALGIALLGTILFTSTGAVLDAQLQNDLPSMSAEARTEVVDAVVVSAGAAIPQLIKEDPEVGNAAATAFTDGTRLSAVAAAGFLLVGFVATFRLHSRRDEEYATS
ncbi:DHA2 family efflux MFS transporter permease subunit [Leucobacter sp. Z1108]|uniref:DHA2 family efflux MFS transporter permease subunit n=1 Tax=Leucobacter sp. Z1108 TaxID=3439066 RepID=UPI003F406CC6